METLFAFGPFLLRPHRREVERQGNYLPLGARAYDTLEALLNERHRVVSKEELLARVWDGVVVEENNLATQVSTLRKLLGPGVIQTIPGRGYRFVADVHTIEQRDVESTPSSVQSHVTARSKSVSMIGRERDLDDALFALQAHHQLTILGTGGVGKTTLALALAQRWIDKVRGSVAYVRYPVEWVALASVSDAAGLATHFAYSLGHESTVVAPGAKARSRPNWLALVTGIWSDAKRDTQLLVLDNAEHLAAEVGELVSALHAVTSDLHVLVTSQVPLRIRGEHCFRLSPLPVPPANSVLAAALEAPALRLLQEAAQEHDATFAITVVNLAPAVQICRALEGIPLALRLAAARFPLLGVAGVAKALHQRLKVLGTPSSESTADMAADDQRHRSLRATLDWSYRQLSPEERLSLCQLAVGRGSISFQLACRLATASLQYQKDADPWDGNAMQRLASLVDRSLIGRHPSPYTVPELGSAAPDGSNDTFTQRTPVEGRSAGLIVALPPSTHYRLPETVRLYAVDQLNGSGDLHAACLHHAQVMAGMMEQAAQEYWSEADGTWLERYAPEDEQVRAALDWASDAEPALACRLLADSCFLLLQLGKAADARKRWLALPDSCLRNASPALRLAHRLTGSRLHWGIDSARMFELAQSAVAISQEEGDLRGEYFALRCMLGSGRVPSEQTASLLERMQSLEDPLFMPRVRAQALLARIDALAFAGDDSPAALESLRKARHELFELALGGGLQTLVVLARIGLADSALIEGDADLAAQRCELLLARTALFGNQRLQVLATLAAARLAQQRADAARSALHDFARLCRQRDWEWFHRYADLFTWLAAQEGRSSLARELMDYADRAALSAGGRSGPSWLRLHAQVQRAVASQPPGPPMAEPPTRPAEICRELGLGETS